MSGGELYRPALNTSCQLPSLPGYRSGHTLDGLVLCGGQDQGAGDCVTLDPSTGQWRASNTLLHSRGHHASWQLEAGVILMGGAAQGEDSERRTSEIVRPDGSGEETFAMKFPTGFVFSTLLTF